MTYDEMSLIVVGFVFLVGGAVSFGTVRVFFRGDDNSGALSPFEAFIQHRTAVRAEMAKADERNKAHEIEMARIQKGTYVILSPNGQASVIGTDVQPAPGPTMSDALRAEIAELTQENEMLHNVCDELRADLADLREKVRLGTESSTTV